MEVMDVLPAAPENSYMYTILHNFRGFTNSPRNPDCGPQIPAVNSTFLYTVHSILSTNKLIPNTSRDGSICGSSNSFQMKQMIDLRFWVGGISRERRRS